jgi:hypothetical protein
MMMAENAGAASRAALDELIALADLVERLDREADQQ